MHQLELIGYTADLKYLVFGDPADERVRFKTPVDPDLVATLDEILQLLDPGAASLMAQVGDASTHDDGPAAGEETEAEEDTGDAPSSSAVEGEPTAGDPNGGPEPGQGQLAGIADLVVRAEEEPSHDPNGEEAARDSKLSPREIQAQLRAGRSTAAVARAAGTDEAWVRRWLPPIEAERQLVLQAVQRTRAVKARLGPSRDLFGDAVRSNLASKGIPLDDDRLHWSASKGDKEPYWVITLEYRSRGRPQKATWRFNPDTFELDPANRLANEIAWTRAVEDGSGSKGDPARRLRRA